MIIRVGIDDSELDIPCVPLRHMLQEPPAGSLPARRPGNKLSAFDLLPLWAKGGTWFIILTPAPPPVTKGDPSPASPHRPSENAGCAWGGGGLGREDSLGRERTGSHGARQGGSPPAGPSKTREQISANVSVFRFAGRVSPRDHGSSEHRGQSLSGEQKPDSLFPKVRVDRPQYPGKPAERAVRGQCRERCSFLLLLTKGL